MRRRRGYGRRPLLAALAVVVALAGVVAIVLALVLGSSASQRPHPMESVFQDDQLLLYVPTPVVSKTLDTLKALGVDEIRVTVLWLAIAPNGGSPVPPAHFDATNPAAYPAVNWAAYDRLDRLAAARGVKLLFNVTAPGPLWAMGHPAPSAKLAPHYRPSAAAFRQFVTAVGRRYSGTYAAPGGALPRVSSWSIWNEPNQSGWLAPQWRRVAGAPVVSSPVLYRAYADAAFSALSSTGHGPSRDTILLGELAPEGSETTSAESALAPLPFLRALYCVGDDYKPLRGARAVVLGCPGGGSTSSFVSAHPGLFDVTGFAHHPYAFFLPPDRSMSDPNFVPLSDLSRLEQALDHIFSAYGASRQLPLYLTEYGYETNPPNPFRGVSLTRQADYLAQAQYMAWKDSRVRAMAQFLLVDTAPNPAFPRGSIGYWSTFQTGLEFLGGARKPSFASYRLPIWIADRSFHSGGSVLVWAMLRPAPNDTAQRAQIQWRGRPGPWRALGSVTTHDPNGFITDQVTPPGSGSVRVQWTAPNRPGGAQPGRSGAAGGVRGRAGPPGGRPGPTSPSGPAPSTGAVGRRRACAGGGVAAGHAW